MKDRCSVLLSTCDKYADAWLPFFTFFKKRWAKCPYKVYINTESLAYSFEGFNIEVINNHSKSWSLRLKNALEHISTEYIILFLEDFFLLDDVDQRIINQSIEIMDKNKRIAVIDFEPDTASLGEQYKPNPDYYYRDIKSMYFLNCQAAIWRRKDLIRFLSPYESPWQFEIYGSQRVKIFKNLFLIRSPYKEMVFNYNVNWTTGYGIHKGKWLKSNVVLFQKNGIEIDLNRMGFYESHGEKEPKCPAPKVTLRYRLAYLLLSGGHLEPRLSISHRFKYLFREPKEYLSMIKRKVIRVFSRDFFEEQE